MAIARLAIMEAHDKAFCTHLHCVGVRIHFVRLSRYGQWEKRLLMSSRSLVLRIT
jgi:hypothetical protein